MWAVIRDRECGTLPAMRRMLTIVLAIAVSAAIAHGQAFKPRGSKPAAPAASGGSIDTATSAKKAPAKKTASKAKPAAKASGDDDDDDAPAKPVKKSKAKSKAKAKTGDDDDDAADADADPKPAKKASAKSKTKVAKKSEKEPKKGTPDYVEFFDDDDDN